MIVTVIPVRPESGVMPVIIGETKKLHALVMLPIGAVLLVTVIGPVVAAVGTTACMTVAESWVTLLAVIPLNFTTEVVLNP